MRLKKIMLFSLVVFFVFSLTVSIGAAEDKFGLILATGGLGDQSFNDLTYQGMERAQEELGITFDYVEPKEIADYETYQRDLAKSGEYGLIVTVGFDQASALEKIATEYPDQKFAIIDMVVDKPNVASYVSKEHQGSFLVGALAGLMEKQNSNPKLNDDQVIGIVGGMDIPLIRKFVAGYEAGAKYVNPELEVLVDYVGGWSDPTTAKEIAMAMNRRGADIVYHAAGGSGLGVFQAAENEDFLAIGVNSNQNHIKPNYIIASMVKKVDVATYDSVKSVLNDSFEPGVHNLGIKDGGIDYTRENSEVEVEEEIIERVEDLKEKIKSGEIEVPDTIEAVESFLN